MDPRERARDQARRAREVVRDNQELFRPIAQAMVQSVRSGGRVLLVGEGRLHALAEYVAGAVLGRDDGPPPHLAVDPIPLDPAGAQATARCIGPYDALLGLSERCEEPFFRALLDAARSRGAKVLALCLGPSRLEGRADIAIDLPEPRAYRIPGLVSTVLHYVAKLGAAELRANPLVRPSRLDEGPRRGGGAAAGGDDGSPDGGEGAEPRGPQNDEPTITLELPDDAFDIAFVDEELGPEVFGPGSGRAPGARAASGRLAPAGAGDASAGASASPGASAHLGANANANAPANAHAPANASAPASANAPAGVGSRAGGAGNGAGDGRSSARLPALPLEPHRAAPAPVLAHAPQPPAASQALPPDSLSGSLSASVADDEVATPDSLDDDELLHPGADGAFDGADAARPGVSRIVMFRCKRCREALLAEPSLAGSRAQCPFCGRRVKVPTSRGRPYRTGKTPLAQGARKVTLRFSSEECRLSIMPQGGFPIDARLTDITAEGIEATIRKDDAGGLGEGQAVRLRLVATAFLEPLVAVGQLERIVPDDINGEELGRLRLLLPLVSDTPRDVRERLARLAELASRDAASER